MPIAMQNASHYYTRFRLNKIKTKRIPMNLYSQASPSVRDTSILIITFKQGLILLAMGISLLMLRNDEKNLDRNNNILL